MKFLWYTVCVCFCKRFCNKKNPSQYITYCKGRVHSFSRFHPACSAARSCQDTKPLNYDDNGITGPDWGHSEVVFGCFPIRCFQHFTSLSVTFHSLLVSSACSFISFSVVHYKRRFFICQRMLAKFLRFPRASCIYRFPISLSLMMASISLGI